MSPTSGGESKAGELRAFVSGGEFAIVKSFILDGEGFGLADSFDGWSKCGTLGCVQCVVLVSGLPQDDSWSDEIALFDLGFGLRLDDGTGDAEKALDPSLPRGFHDGEGVARLVMLPAEVVEETDGADFL